MILPLPGASQPGLFKHVPHEVVVVGMGQLGVLFSEGFLRLGHPVVPVLRGALWPDFKEEPELIFIATGEDDLSEALTQVPPPLRDRIVLIQNELRPDQWQGQLATDPSLAIVWFEKKPGKLPHVVRKSVVSGPRSALVECCLDVLDLPHERASSYEEIAHALVLKNLYILSLNFAGLLGVNKAGDLLEARQNEFGPLIADLLRLEARLLASAATPWQDIILDEDRLKSDLRDAIVADPDHGCAGRTARVRLARTRAHAAKLKLALPRLTALAEIIS